MCRLILLAWHSNSKIYPTYMDIMGHLRKSTILNFYVI